MMNVWDNTEKAKTYDNTARQKNQGLHYTIMMLKRNFSQFVARLTGDKQRTIVGNLLRMCIEVVAEI